MNSLCERIASSYAQHPKFHFDQQAFELDADRLDAFNRTYQFLQGYSGRLKHRQYLSCKRQCVDALADVFVQLKAQASQPQEIRFLDELHAESRRALGEEIDHFHTSSTNRDIDTADIDIRDKVLRLQTDRHYFGALPPEAVKEILDIGSADLAGFREAVRQGRLRREDLSLNTGPHVRAIARILNREYERQGALDALSAYAGRRIKVSGLALELSVPQAQWWRNAFNDLPRPPKTLYAHLDESIHHPKSIVYLTDVDPSTGPTSCYPQAYEALGMNPLQELVGRVVGTVGSSADSPLKEYYKKQYHQAMTSERFRQHFMRLPEQIRFNSHLGWDIYPESDAERSLAEAEKVMTGRAGTYIIFDGARLLHRGGMLQQGERIALQVIFSDASVRRRIANKIRRIRGTA